jgi:hypothetical protein
MLRRGHLPSPTLLVRLTDGRLKLNASLGSINEAREHLGRLRNEYGPAEVALWISRETIGGAVRVAVENLDLRYGGASSTAHRVEVPTPMPRDSKTRGNGENGEKSLAVQAENLRDNGPVWPRHAFAGAGSARRSTGLSASSKKAAIREASLGMTTGWLPNVESSLLPSGARSWSV